MTFSKLDTYLDTYLVLAPDTLRRYQRGSVTAIVRIETGPVAGPGPDFMLNRRSARSCAGVGFRLPWQTMFVVSRNPALLRSLVERQPFHDVKSYRKERRFSGKRKMHSGQLHIKWATFQRTATRSETNMIRPIFFVVLLAVLLAVSLSCSSAPDAVRMGTEGGLSPFQLHQR